MIQVPTKESYIIDTSAIICWFQDEDGADTVEELLIKSEDDLIELYIAFVSFTFFLNVSFNHPPPTPSYPPPAPPKRGEGTFLFKRKVWLHGKSMENR